MAQAGIYGGSFVRGPYDDAHEEPLPLVQRRAHSLEDGRWMPPSHYGPSQVYDYDEDLDGWHDPLAADRPSFAEEWESVTADERQGAEREWRRRRPRRIMVKMLGWSSILAALLGVGYIGLTTEARDAMLTWGTFAAGAPALR